MGRDGSGGSVGRRAHTIRTHCGSSFKMATTFAMTSTDRPTNQPKKEKKRKETAKTKKIEQ